MKNISTRLVFGLSVFAAVASATSLALAETGSADGRARPQCSGEHRAQGSAADHAQRAAERFNKADKNGDGFLTKEEVGDQRWARIQVADSNNDGKVSLAELAQARADGKLGHKHDQRPA